MDETRSHAQNPAWISYPFPHAGSAGQPIAKAITPAVQPNPWGQCDSTSAELPSPPFTPNAILCLVYSVDLLEMCRKCNAASSAVRGRLVRNAKVVRQEEQRDCKMLRRRSPHVGTGQTLGFRRSFSSKVEGSHTGQGTSVQRSWIRSRRQPQKTVTQKTRQMRRFCHRASSVGKYKGQ